MSPASVWQEMPLTMALSAFKKFLVAKKIGKMRIPKNHCSRGKWWVFIEAIGCSVLDP